MNDTIRRKGRPKDPLKAHAILQAARTLFLEKGLEVTTEEIARVAGVAKATLYSNFADKEMLIEAVLRQESDLTISDDDFEQRHHLPLANVLTAFGNRFVRFINQRELTGWDRLIASASIRHPDLPKRFYAAGPGRAQQMLEAIIAEAITKGTLRECDPGEAADDLAGLWLGMTSLEIKLGARNALTDEEINHRVAHALDIFMRSYSVGNI
ncbi:TetR/AcrR family transcriptional regulator [Serratia odorifera]|uniref:Transcriptional regulator, TetR family n=2 Tax=Serratia odorifera TaxID=618 RepID=D4DWJ8_SEROD|nr:TetR/AcrR family transcriptional regulator [Serratia odorifera]EFE97970.1 transcriptional regulator, TetR family [Serratia odorifera DSM 4582]MBJ2065788.1 TetR/AcrR family transcriptional regulator [Serratia odorifera]PNK92480.1 TetR/AcrR family transcriptional regulator [Serratia odorifera]RII73570.1 TetR/AcrR family transcriptional regulator [Serratia odorifera]VDZ52060.1 pyrimidine utilization regulatory protein R [Serratia odorifera]